MRLKQYINESSNFYDKISDKILKNCKPYFDLVKKTKVQNKFLWRGVRRGKVNGFEYFKTRKDREPLDTCDDLHALSDNLFKKYYGVKARSQTVFCYSSEMAAATYGKTVIVIPSGKFDYIWSPKIYDLYYYIDANYEDDILAKICFGAEDNKAYYTWSLKYGENTNGGKWFYNGFNTKKTNAIEAKEYVIKDIMKELNISKKEAEELFDNNKLEWVPHIEYDEYLELRKGDAVKKLDNIIKKLYYKNKGFKELMDNPSNSNHEVMLNCDSYYLINDYKITDAIREKI